MSKHFDFASELFSTNMTEFARLAVLHWREVGRNQDLIPLDIDFEFYLQSEAIGFLRFYTMRQGGKLVGYWLGFSRPAPHYKSTKHAFTDADYIANEHRWAALWFYRFIERQLLAEGVVRIYNAGKPNANAKCEFLEKLGYAQREIGYEKLL